MHDTSNFPTYSMDAIAQITDVQEAFRAFNRRDFDKAESLFTKYVRIQLRLAVEKASRRQI